MHRFFVSGENIRAGRVVFDSGEARHIERVLRLGAGDSVMVFDGSGYEYLVRLNEQGRDRLAGEVIEKAYIDRETASSVYLVQGLGKGDKMDTIIQKAVEIGVKAVYPLACERSVVRLEGDKAVKRVERWQEIAVEACKQCRRNVVPEIKPVIELTALCQEMHGKCALMLYEKEQELGISNYLKSNERELAGKELFLLVGPEGGFSPTEVEMARQHGCTTVTLGSRILRTETAGIVAASIILYELGDLG
ncbi:MAG: 16S rRNA (uracil(1498)-N(3))-methyltransferase [Syntrophomonadaceae bacterium]|nr:16S rRNA (uracil(1498)-N(3))-methyltransferase [Syntrophomonadaceae bacterium]